MTSDAKIGLLLGLVFIFVIAFIINGLPNFGSRAQNAEAAPVLTDHLGLAEQARNAQERLDWTSLLEQDGTDRVIASEEPPVGTPDVVLPDPQSVVARDSGEVRSIYPLDSLVGGVSRTIEDLVKGFSETSEAVTMQNQTEEPVPALDILRPAGVAQTGAPPAPARRLPVKTYEVQDGDALATVAKKAYGPEEGNRLVNIRRIYEANRTILKSPDEIFVGQKLVIPPLPNVVEGTERPNPTLSEALFEKVQAVGKRNLVDIKEVRSEGRWYVVQEGDNLWKIAARQLGSGARCDEIAKLNTDILKNKDVLDIGMRLLLPLK
jgi:LysM repeat protein